MTTVYDIPADLFNPALAQAMADQKAVSMPDWGQYVKTAVDRERPPTQDDWWYLRTAAILRKVARNGPVGVTISLKPSAEERQRFHAEHARRCLTPHHSHRFAAARRCGLVEKVPTKEVEGVDGKVQLYAGRRITAAGQKLVDNVAHSVREEAEAQYPGLAKY